MMELWVRLILSLLVLLSPSQCTDEHPSDSLKTAIEAVSRRQRDLAEFDSGYYPSGGLVGPRDELAFVAAPRDFTGDGQPENIGYGYQKSISSPSGMFAPPSQLAPAEQGYSAKSKALENLIMDYLEDELKPDDDAQESYYPNSDAKRSAFRERYQNGKLEAMKKRYMGSSFRERAHQQPNDDTEQKRAMMTEALIRKMEEEEEDERRERGEDHNANSPRYLELLRMMWRKYRKENPDDVEIEDINADDVGEILNYLRESGAIEEEDVDGIRTEIKKRQHYGNDYDYHTHNTAMGGWGGLGYKKRWNQRLDGDENQKSSFLYSLKFVSPAANHEAIESLREEDEMGLPDEHDRDILRLAAAESNRRDPAAWWLPALERGEAPEELFEAPSEEEYQRLMLAQQGEHRVLPNRKRLKSNYDVPDILVAPEKRYLYDTAVIRKRFPVTKRSSNYYTSPPLLHHKNFINSDISERRKKKDAMGISITTTDPKVAQELNQLFSSSHSESPLPLTATTHAPVTENSTTTHNDTSETKHGSSASNKSAEQPIAMSREEQPLEIRKKSINWSEYFGIDRRRKKSEEPRSVNEEWLVNQYLNTLAHEEPSLLHADNDFPHTIMKKGAMMQPFDTRVFNSDIFARNAQHKLESKKNGRESNEDSTIDNMDDKLQHIEDQIVNEAVKYTGAHEGTTDSKEIQDVKDKVLARLAAAYSLEKMRQALSEFKTSLQAQRMSKYNPENRKAEEGEEKHKRVAVKKEKVEDAKDEKDKKGGKEEDDDSGEFLDGPVVVQPLSEGDMGRQEISLNNEVECPALEHIFKTCHSMDAIIGDHAHLFLPLCTLHQICYLCGPEVGSPSPAACDLMFVSEADNLCLSDADCQRAARKGVTLLQRQDEPGEGRCWRNPCIAHYFLNSPPLLPVSASASTTGSITSDTWSEDGAVVE